MELCLLHDLKGLGRSASFTITDTGQSKTVTPSSVAGAGTARIATARRNSITIAVGTVSNQAVPGATTSFGFRVEDDRMDFFEGTRQSDGLPSYFSRYAAVKQ